MQLLEPSVEYETAYLDMLDDWHSTGEDVVPFPLKYDASDFDSMVQKCLSFKIERDPGFVQHSTFWLFDKGQIVGVSNLRHYLNDHLLIDGGHIGFGIRPSCRRKGYGSKILELTLLEAQKMGIEKALLTCDKVNVGSASTIIKNGGVL